jgi:alanine racemase
MNELSWLEIDLSRLDANVAWWRGVLETGVPALECGGADPALAGARQASCCAKPLLRDGEADADDPKQRLRRRTPKLCAVVKANAYGLGAVQIAQRLERRGIDMLAVYAPSQAEELIDAGISTPILVLQPTRELERTGAVRAAATAGRLHLAINDPAQLNMVDLLGRAFDCRIPAHLHVDTGMSRAGLSQAQFLRVLSDLPRFRYALAAGVWSHLASPMEDVAFADEQLARLDQALGAAKGMLPPDILVHIGATHAACRGQRFHRGMVRIGLGLYGYGPDQLNAAGRVVVTSDALGARQCPVGTALLPVLRWLGRIIHIQRYPRGATVGYGCTHRLERDSILGVVPVGYADGYPQSLGNKATVRLADGCRERGCPQPLRTPLADAAAFPVLGAVSMDQIVIDLTPPSGADFGAAGAIEPGAVVELVSSDPASPLSLPNLARTAGTSAYELLCRLSPRLPRTYVSVEAVSAADTLPVRRPNVTVAVAR